MQELPSLPPEASAPAGGARVGDLVVVRRQRWRVADVRDYDATRLLTLVGAGPANGGTERRFLTPFDCPERTAPRERPRRVDARAWQRTLRALLADQGPADGLRAAARARIELLPHQLEPALALLQGLGSRVLLADEVGLGKTIQAALAIAELRARGLVDRVLILTPAGLREQWHEELAERFSLDAAIVDARELRHRASLAPVGVNPWTTVPVAIASTDFVKRPEVLPGACASRWDVVVVDEAHNAGAPSDRHEAASALCRQAPYVLLLSATPHNGDTRAFNALCDLGACERDALLVFRRSRQSVMPGSPRHVHRLSVRPTRAERVMHDRLAAYARVVHAERGDADQDLRLALTVLLKRALSSPWALAQSVRRRLACLGPPGPSVAQLALPFDDGEGEFEGGDDTPTWAGPALADQGRERALLEGIATAAQEAIPSESKLQALSRLLRRLRARGERIIVFTEYRDTLLHLQRRLAFGTAILHGGLARDERRRALDDFASGRQTVLLATDAAGEGLNLQEHCRVVVNLELPWNPIRLEQRAGRVDRIGQARIVHAFHLVASDTGESSILNRLRARIARAREDIAAADPLAFAMPDEDLPRLSLTIPTSREHARLLLARRLGTGRERLPAPRADGPVIGCAKGALRQWLAGRTLVLTRTAVEDGCGRPVAARLTAMLARVEISGLRHLRGERLDALCQAIARACIGMDRDEKAWADEVRLVHEACLTRRIERGLAIERAVTQFIARATQPGLFDRRADTERRASHDDLAEHQAESARRLALLARTRRLTPVPTAVTMVVLP